MGRPRAFDHEGAVRRHGEGESIAALAVEYGVSKSAIYQAIERVDPERHERALAYHRTWQSSRFRRPCIRGCGRLAWHQAGREGVCIRCRNAERTTTVGEHVLLCTRCGEWKPDEAFPMGGHRKIGRRGRHSTCRGCQAEVKREYRERRKVPCVRCGKPCLPASEKGRRAADTGLCLPCYRESVRRAA